MLLVRWRRFYGAHPLHLLTMAAGFTLAGYIMVTFHPATLWNPTAWWQSILVWLAAAIILHDLVLFPVYALADRVLAIAAKRQRRRQRGPLRVPVRNFVRVPTLGSGLALMMFFPGIIREGSATYVAATGQTQQPFLGRWLLFTAAMFSASALLYAIRLALAQRHTRGVDGRATHRPSDGPDVHPLGSRMPQSMG
ncbi:hypothetical protein A5764_18775 [Mycobacterium sp. 852002-51057_SCH5723018]|nr:hypothetical protein A5764_18775 [Mycobacterium sp. 852002-51057_SCH5723018]